MHVVGVSVWEGAKCGLSKKVSKRNVFTPRTLSVIHLSVTWRGFSVKNPYIVLNSLRTTSEQNQQNGLKEIILGLIHMVRNVTAHELRIRWDINENDAIDILQQVSFVHKYMDQCIPVRHLT